MKKVLIANRGEIAVRVMRACRELGIADGRGVLRLRSRRAARARRRRGVSTSGRAAPARATCASTRSIDAARATGADAVHPGYGFLAENAAFARACRDAGLTFIGPSPEAIALMGSKTAARERRDRAPACRSCPAPSAARRATAATRTIARGGRRDRLSR